MIAWLSSRNLLKAFGAKLMLRACVIDMCSILWRLQSDKTTIIVKPIGPKSKLQYYKENNIHLSTILGVIEYP